MKCLYQMNFEKLKKLVEEELDLSWWSVFNSDINSRLRSVN